MANFRKMKQERLKPELIRLLIEDCQGNIGLACKKVGITRTTFYNWTDLDPEFANSVNEAKKKGSEDLLDMAEAALAKNIRLGNVPSVIFTLKTLGRNRGFSELDLNTDNEHLSVTVNTIPKPNEAD